MMKNREQIVVVVAIIVLCHAYLAPAVEVMFYDNFEKKGEQLFMNVQNCTNMPFDWHDRASSIDIHESICIKFFEHGDCKGKYITFRSELHADYQDNLKNLGFNDVISSVSPCSLQIEAGRYVIQNLGDNKMLTVVESQLYSRVFSKYWRNFKTQHWDVGQVAGSEYLYDLMPAEYPSQKPVIYNVEDFQRLGKVKFEKPAFLIESVDDWKYVIKDSKTRKCLATARKDEIVLAPCLHRAKAHQWVFRLIP